MGQPSLEEKQEDSPKISIHAITGAPNPKTMRMVGRIGSKEVVILEDTGSTHNILDPAIVPKAGLTLPPTKTIKVKIANGELILCEGRCDQVELRVQGHIHNRFLCLNTGGL